MFRSKLLYALAGLGLAAGAALPALAWADGGDPDLHPERPEGYYIWHNGNNWHLRTHGPGDQHHFTARLSTDGEFRHVEGVDLEEGDGYAVRARGHSLGLDFHTFGAYDGVDFHAQGSECVRFNLRLSGEAIPVEQIYLGEAGRHPAANPFRLCR